MKAEEYLNKHFNTTPKTKIPISVVVTLIDEFSKENQKELIRLLTTLDKRNYVVTSGFEKEVKKLLKSIEK